jgi:hypothetical protein
LSVPTFPLRAAAALFLERQWLDRPRGRRLGPASLERFALATGGVQIDSINVLERAHHLTLWSRFGVYDRTRLERLLYRRRVLFEYWAHAACFVAAADFPAWRRAMLDYRRRHKGWGFLKKHPRILASVEGVIRERGPLGNADFERARPGGAGWWNWKAEAHALDHLWMSGRLAVHSRLNFQKRFELMERVLPGPLENPPLDASAFRHWHLERSLAAMGAATETDLRMYLTYPRIEAAKRRAMLASMIREGSVVELAIAGERGRWFARAADLDALAAAGRRRSPSRGATLLSPFDSLLWHRERAARLFGFDYRIEVYVPGPRRVHGYYTLPLLVDGQFVGRVDAKHHRERGVLELRRAHFEPWVVRGGPPPAARWGEVGLERAIEGLAESARSLAAFIGAPSISVSRVEPERLRGAVSAALAAEGG